MASRNERHDEQIKEDITKRTSNVVIISAIAAIVVLGAINAFGNRPVPDLVFAGLFAVIIPDAIKFLAGRR